MKAPAILVDKAGLEFVKSTIKPRMDDVFAEDELLRRLKGVAIRVIPSELVPDGALWGFEASCGDVTWYGHRQ